MNKKKDLDIVSPLDFFDLDVNKKPAPKTRHHSKFKKSPPFRKHVQARPRLPQPVKKKMARGIFVTGTDTNVGKTVALCVLGVLLKQQGLDVGVMKPVQCGGGDADFLKNVLQIKDSLNEINPYHAPDPLAPDLAFRRQRINVEIGHILKTYQRLREQHDMLLVEGAGGLMVPIKDQYLVADLIKDLDLELIIVSRLGLGTINHTLLTIHQSRELGIPIKGVIFSEAQSGERGLSEKTNPQTIGRLGNVTILGIIPYLESMKTKDMTEAISKEILTQCKTRLDLRSLAGGRKEIPQSWAFWDKKYVWHPFTQMKDWLQDEPLVIEEAKGCYLYDAQGNKFLDGVASLWVNVHGHRHPLIDRAIKNQVNQLSHSTFLGLSHPSAAELAKKLVEVAPAGLERVFYSDNGSTAVEVAIKMAYQYWQNMGQTQKTKIVHLKNSYHGDTLGSVSVGGIDLFHKVYHDLVFATLQVDFPDGYRAPEGKYYPDYAFECLGQLEKLLQESNARIAALVIEPIVQAAAGIIVWPDGILKRIKEFCQMYGIFLIADEVATGFGRTGKMFACEHESVTPDFLCLAKGMTGGYLPLAATLTTRRVFEGFLFDYKEQKAFFHGHTYTANPLGCAAALANLKIFEKEQTLRRLQPKIKYLGEKLRMFYNLPSVGQVRQKGFMVGIELVKNKKTKEPYSWEEKMGIRVCREVRKHGVILRPLGNVIVLMPPLSISMQELEKLLKVTYEAIERIGYRV